MNLFYFSFSRKLLIVSFLFLGFFSFALIAAFRDPLIFRFFLPLLFFVALTEMSVEFFPDFMNFAPLSDFLPLFFWAFYVFFVSLLGNFFERANPRFFSGSFSASKSFFYFVFCIVFSMAFVVASFFAFDDLLY